MKPPATAAGYEALLAVGRLVDLAGRPLQRRPCAFCDGATVGATCPMSLPCPTCARVWEGHGLGGVGRPCCRPSGHQAHRLHAARVRAAEAADDAREAAGDPTLPARWEDQPSPAGP